MDGEGNERKFTLSFSSEEPYERWWGNEILDHASGAVDLARLNEIGVVLFNTIGIRSSAGSSGHGSATTTAATQRSSSTPTNSRRSSTKRCGAVRSRVYR